MTEHAAHDAGDQEISDLAEQVEQLKNELEAAQIERDQYKSATATMAQALEQMNALLRDSSVSIERNPRSGG